MTKNTFYIKIPQFFCVLILLLSSLFVPICTIDAVTKEKSKMVEISGNQAKDAIIKDSQGHIVPNNNLNRYENYTVTYHWKAKDASTIKAGDQAIFYLPANIIIPTNYDFPVKDFKGHTIGNFKINKDNSQCGYLTFNDHIQEYHLRNVSGNIVFGVNGIQSSSSSQYTPLYKMGEISEENKKPIWTIMYNEECESLTDVHIVDILLGNQIFYGDISVQYGYTDDKDQFIVQKEDINPGYVHIKNKQMDIHISKLSTAVRIVYQSTPTIFNQKIELENEVKSYSKELGTLKDAASVYYEGYGDIVGNLASKVVISKQNEFGEAIGDAYLTLSTEGKVIDSWISQEKESHEYFIEKNKEYTLTETQAPEGYEVAESITFRVTEAGKVEVKEGNQWKELKDNKVIMVDQYKKQDPITPGGTPNLPETPIIPNDDFHNEKSPNHKENTGLVLPQTGSKTIKYLPTVGGVLVVAAIAGLLLGFRKKQK